MSQKITSKNLSYDTSVPPFLRALQAQASGATGPDPILAAQRRAAKKRSGSEEAEDEPLVVDEDGNPVNLNQQRDDAVKEPDVDDDAPEPTKQVQAAIGGRKRKVGKVIGDDGVKEEKNEVKKGDTETKTDKEEAPKERKPKKKAKKIKLSFDEE